MSQFLFALTALSHHKSYNTNSLLFYKNPKLWLIWHATLVAKMQYMIHYFLNTDYINIVLIYPVIIEDLLQDSIVKAMIDIPKIQVTDSKCLAKTPVTAQ